MILLIVFVLNLDAYKDKTEIIEQFFRFARVEQKKEVEALIISEGLKKDSAKRYIQAALNHEYVSENGIELNEALPKMSPLNANYRNKKQQVFQKISTLVEKFKGIGGEI